MSNKVNLFVNGKNYDGWKDVEVSIGLKSLSGSFSLSITDRWSGQREPWIIKPNDKCTVLINDNKLITGFVDKLNPSYDSNSRKISVGGRDKTADFVDCSFELNKKQFNGQTLDLIAKALAKPFGIGVIMIGKPGDPFKDTKMQEGEACFESLDRLAKMRGFLLTTNGLGSIVITRPSGKRATTALEQGKNILSMSANYDNSDRHSDYIVKAQTNNFAEEIDPSKAFQVKATAKDKGVNRYRPLVIIAEQGATQNEAQTRVNWEATVRAAKAAKFQVTVQGWTQADGSLWLPNQLVRVKSSWVGANGDLLITNVKFKQNENSTTAVLDLERPDAYKPEPILEESKDPLARAITKDLAENK